MTRGDQVELLKVEGAINAEPILAALRANGIPAGIVGEAVGRVYGLTLNGLGVVTIVVPGEFEEKARELLAAGELRQLEVTEEDTGEGGPREPGR
jgi:Putative prokaryotic signal transducing protein